MGDKELLQDAGYGLRVARRAGYEGVMKNYRDLDIYKISFDLATKIHTGSVQ